MSMRAVLVNVCTELAEEVLNCEVIEAVLGQLTLREELLQDVLPGVQGVLGELDVAGGHQLLGEFQVVRVHY